MSVKEDRQVHTKKDKKMKKKGVTFASTTKSKVICKESSESEDESLSSEEDQLVGDRDDYQTPIHDDDDDQKTPSGAPSGWADAMSRLLNTQVKTKNFILSKGKKDKDVIMGPQKKDKPVSEFEVVNEDGESEVVKDTTDKDCIKPHKTTPKSARDELMKKIVKKAKEGDREKEARLNAIGTRGVVQLFNAVHQQHLAIKRKLDEAGPSETKRDKALASFDKGSFIDTLRKVESKLSDKSDGEEEPKSTNKKRKKKQDTKKKFDTKKVFSDIPVIKE